MTLSRQGTATIPVPHGVEGGRARTLRVHNHKSAHRRLQVPVTQVEKRIAAVCSKPPSERDDCEVDWLVDQMRRISRFANTPHWRLAVFCRNLGVLFLSEGTDIAPLCNNPNFAYVVLAGKLLPIARGLSSHQHHHNSPRNHPPVAGKDVSRGREQAYCSKLNESMPTPPPAQTPCLPHSHHARKSVCDPSIPGEGSLCGHTSVSKSLFGSLSSSVEIFGPVGPGKFLGEFLDGPIGWGESAGSIRSGAREDMEGEEHKEWSVVSGDSERAGSASRGGMLGRGQLLARETSCVGRIGKCVLDELEGFEPLHLHSEKMALLERSEVFSEGFDLWALKGIAGQMEKWEHGQGCALVTKGGAANRVILVASGEAICMGDISSDSKTAPTSLRVRTGQMFGAEDVMSGMSAYSCSLVAATPSVVSFSLPAHLFLEAIKRVDTQALRRLAGRAHAKAVTYCASGEEAAALGTAGSLERGANRLGSPAGNARGLGGGRGQVWATPSRIDTLAVRNVSSPLVGGAPRRRSTASAAGTGSERRAKNGQGLEFGGDTTGGIALSPVPSFSSLAARGYMRLSGTNTASTPGQRFECLANIWTPWWPSSPPSSAPSNNACARGAERAGAAGEGGGQITETVAHSTSVSGQRRGAGSRKFDFGPGPRLPEFLGTDREVVACSMGHAGQPVVVPCRNLLVKSTYFPLPQDKGGSGTSPNEQEGKQGGEGLEGGKERVRVEEQDQVKREGVGGKDVISCDGSTGKGEPVLTDAGQKRPVIDSCGSLGAMKSGSPTGAVFADDHCRSEMHWRGWSRREERGDRFRQIQLRSGSKYLLSGETMRKRGGGVDVPTDARNTARKNKQAANIQPGASFRAPPTEGKKLFARTMASNGGGDNSNVELATAGRCFASKIVAARHAVSSRSQRDAVCRRLSLWHGPTGYAAQRAFRGPFVMSRMKDARARGEWRPAVVVLDGGQQ